VLKRLLAALRQLPRPLDRHHDGPAPAAAAGTRLAHERRRRRQRADPAGAPMKYALLVFLGTWLSVFTLGLQSLNVNQGHYFAAAVTSLGIGAGHVLLYKYMPTADWLELGGYFAGGVTGITASMWFHRRAKAWLSLQEHTEVAHCGGRVHNSDTH
jgi:hypothetical protein